MHLGSQIFDLEPLFEGGPLFKRTLYRSEKRKTSLQVLDIGEGWGSIIKLLILKRKKQD